MEAQAGEQTAAPVEQAVINGSATETGEAAPTLNEQAQGGEPAAQLGGEPAQGDGQQAPVDEGGSDWRAALAGGDNDTLALLNRHATPESAGKALREANSKITELRSQVVSLPENATDEQIAAYREKAGIPTEGTFEAYGVEVPEGYQTSEAEQTLLDGFVADMHAGHMPKDQLNNAIGKYFEIQTAAEQDMRKQDIATEEAWSEDLREEWGRGYKDRLSVTNAFFAERFADEGVRNAIVNARMPDGGRVSAHPEFVKMMHDFAAAEGRMDSLHADVMEANGTSLWETVEKYRSLGPGREKDSSFEPYLKAVQGLQARGEMDKNGNKTYKK